jgi:deoxycytidylate deaminase
MAHVYEPSIEHKVCAVIVRGGAILSVGFNQRKTNAFVEYYTDKVRGHGRGYYMSTHAEQNAILSIRKKVDLTGSTIYVARLRSLASKYGKVGLSRPCNICQKVLLSYGIKKAYYTITDNEYGVMKITENTINSEYSESEIFLR